MPRSRTSSVRSPSTIPRRTRSTSRSTAGTIPGSRAGAGSPSSNGCGSTGPGFRDQRRGARARGVDRTPAQSLPGSSHGGDLAPLPPRPTACAGARDGGPDDRRRRGFAFMTAGRGRARGRRALLRGPARGGCDAARGGPRRVPRDRGGDGAPRSSSGVLGVAQALTGDPERGLHLVDEALAVAEQTQQRFAPDHAQPIPRTAPARGRRPDTSRSVSSAARSPSRTSSAPRCSSSRPPIASRGCGTLTGVGPRPGRCSRRSTPRSWRAWPSRT